MSRRRARDGSNEVRRRLAATAATAALAVGGTATASSPVSARPKAPPRTNVSRSSQVGAARGDASIDAARRAELSAHRRLLAAALADELGRDRSEPIERALAAIDTAMSEAYARGARPRLSGGLPAELGRRIGVGEREVADAYEAMSRHALDRRRDPAAR